MVSYLVKRFFMAIAIIFVMMLIVFFGINVIGDPVLALVDPTATQAEIEETRQALGLDKSIVEQFFIFIYNVLQGNLGNSFIFDRPAVGIILEHLPATLELAFFAFVISLVVGIPCGLFAGLYPKKLLSKIILSASVLGFSLPSFWVGIVFIMLFAVTLGWLPALGRGETTEFLGVEVSFLTWDGLKHILLPAINLSLFKISLIIRLVRAGTIEVMSQDYIKFAYSKGIKHNRIVRRHVSKNVMIPVVTVIGIELGHLIAYSVVTETIFSWPGTGKLIVESIFNLDRPVVVAYLMMITLLFVIINFIVDVIYALLDPRIKIIK